MAIIFHMITNSLFASFSCHRCLLSSDSFLLFSCVNDIRWFLYLALNGVAVRPMYVSFVYWVVNVACYTTSLTRHSPFSGQSSFFAMSLLFLLSLG